MRWLRHGVRWQPQGDTALAGDNNNPRKQSPPQPVGGKVHGNLGFSGFRTGTGFSQSGVALRFPPHSIHPPPMNA